jgi:hypothetical protein
MGEGVFLLSTCNLSPVGNGFCTVRRERLLEHFRAAKSIRTSSTSSSSSHHHRHLISMFTSCSHNSPFPNTSSSTAAEHGRLSSTLRLPLWSWSPPRPLCAGIADDVLAAQLVHSEIVLLLGSWSWTFSVRSTFFYSIFITFHPQAVGLNPARWHCRRHSRRRAEYIPQRSLHISPIYTLLRSTSTTSHPCRVGKNIKYDFAAFVPCSARTIVASLYFSF